GARQTLAADKLINKCTITFSPYAQSDIYDGKVDEADVTDEPGGAEYSLDDPYNPPAIPGFSLIYASSGRLPYTLHSGQLVRFDAGFSSASGVAVIIGRRGNVVENHKKVYGTIARAYPNGYDKPTSATTCLTTTPSFIGNPSGNRESYKLKIEIDALVDVRYNPYEAASEDNEEGAWSRLQNRANFGYIPATLLLKDRDDNILYHFDNRSCVTTDGLPTSPGEWKSGAPSRPDTYMLCWYSVSDRKSASGFGGWQKNRAIIGYYRKDMPTLYEKRGTGDYIPLPPIEGYIELSVMDRIYQFDYGREEKVEVYSELRWVGLKDPKISVVDSWGLDIDEDDIEVTAWINRLATDEMSLSTECGTMDGAAPNARGVYVTISDKTPIDTRHFSRSGVTDSLERLLIGTIYSQYADRHTKLSGKCDIIPAGIPVCSEINQPAGRRFIMAAETQDCRRDTAEAVWVEVLSDNYQGLEFEE
ncbi:MAG: hypothetical protein K2J06_07335, partial [Muribaculaceae bacterium]|nr:hypothetical protein [Muribaculaceae bacterium]